MPLPAKSFLSVRREQGIILPFALFILLAATMLTLGLIRANIMSLKVGGASVMAVETQLAAEVVLGNFFVRNPDSYDPANPTTMGRYMRNNADSRCGTTTELAANSSLYFDCNTPTATLPTGASATAMSPQRIGCGLPQRTSSPSSMDTRWNYLVFDSQVTNTTFGSEGQAGSGRGALVAGCPLDS